MERFILRNAGTNAPESLQHGIDWLIAQGGGTVAADSREVIQRMLGFESGVDVDAFFKQFKDQGIKFGHMRRGLPFKGNVVAAFTSDGILRMLDNRPGITQLLVLEGNDRDTRWWIDRRNPAEFNDVVDTDTVA